MLDYYNKNSPLDRSGQLAGTISVLEHFQNNTSGAEPSYKEKEMLKQFETMPWNERDLELKILKRSHLILNL